MRRKPDHLKLLIGTARSDRAAPASGPALPLLEGVPPPPGWLKDRHARAEWRRLAPQLRTLKLLTEGTVGLLAQFCALHGQLVRSWRSGTTPTAALLAAYRLLAADLGLPRIAATPPGAEASGANRFEHNGRRPA